MQINFKRREFPRLPSPSPIIHRNKLFAILKIWIFQSDGITAPSPSFEFLILKFKALAI